MRAVVFDAVGSPLRITELAPPECPPDGAVIDVKATGICRSDWHAWRGHEVVPLPHIPGHEFSGVVAETGALVSAFAVGDRVTVPFVNGCGACDWCRAGQAQVCPYQTQPGFSDQGSFAEQVAIRAADFNLVRLPDAVEFVTAAALGCRFATAFHAVTTQARLRAEEWQAVFGCGGVGLSAVTIAVTLGARVVAVDPSPAALARAAELGAEATVDATDPVATVRSITGGGAHSSIDARGSAETALHSIRSLRPRGRHVQVGLMFGDDEQAPLPWDLVISRELQVLGAHGMAASEYAAMLAMIADERLQPQRLIGSVIDLELAGEALMAMDQPVPGAAGMVIATI